MDESWIKNYAGLYETIGFSVDSINDETNRKIGRCDRNGNTILAGRIVELCGLIRRYAPECRIKINTVVSALNKDEVMCDFIDEIAADRWKILRMKPFQYGSFSNLDIQVSNEEFEEFVERNREKNKEKMEKQEEKEAGKEVDYDQKLEAMIPVIKKEMPLKCHCHRADDILTVIRIAKEYDIEVTLDHVTDGRSIIPQIKESGFPCILGPCLGHKSKYEVKNMSFETANEFYKAGIPFCIITDSPVVPEQYLSLSAALAAKAGLPEYEAIKAITINPAKILKLDDRIGSIKTGKDADFVICTKNILDTQNEIKTVYVNGKKEA